MRDIMSKLPVSPVVAIGIGVVVAVLVFIVWPIASYNGVRNDMISKEQALSAQYLDNQNELSSYVSGFYEQLGVAKAKSAQMDKILLDAVKGRYDNQGGSVQIGKGSPLFSAITEAYPILSGLDIYNKVADYITAGRQAYKDKQSKLLVMLRNYDTWRKSGLIHSKFASMAGAPSDNLRAQIGTSAVYGRAAEDRMYSIVLASAATKAYQTGTMEPLTVPAG